MQTAVGVRGELNACACCLCVYTVISYKNDYTQLITHRSRVHVCGLIIIYILYA